MDFQKHRKGQEESFLTNEDPANISGRLSCYGSSFFAFQHVASSSIVAFDSRAKTSILLHHTAESFLFSPFFPFPLH